jgi:tetratricopeptide (TPR) repeat protein
MGSRSKRRGRLGFLFAAITGLLVAACGEGELGGPTAAGDEPAIEAEVVESAAADPSGALDRLLLPEEFRRQQERLLAEAEAELEARPDDPEALIWVGRRLAYLARFDEAIATYSRGIELYPEDARFYRHRGHRFITTRRFDRAVADLERASELIAGLPDAVEPDGLPNDLGIPTTTLYSNIWYHLGLALYLQANFEGAVSAYRECLKVSRNPDMLSATAHWLYMSLRRLGRQAEAEEVLLAIHPDMEIIENHEYHRLLLMYKGQEDPWEVWSSVRDEEGLSTATLGYGVGNWYLYNDDPDRAREIFAEVVDKGRPPAVGFIAAEAGLARFSESPRDAAGSEAG